MNSMAAKHMLFLYFTFTYLIVQATATRDLMMKPGHELILTRLQEAINEGDAVDCWSSLMELKSCSNEIVLFFINGQADIGPDCCRAISVITRSCWPAMLTSLGFTAEEGNVLRGYCDAVAAPSDATTPASAPTMN